MSLSINVFLPPIINKSLQAVYNHTFVIPTCHTSRISNQKSRIQLKKQKFKAESFHGGLIGFPTEIAFYGQSEAVKVVKDEK
jgi:hypothetical protein